MEEQEKFPIEKKTYEPPTVSRISLRPTEAVLGHCKMTGTSSGPTGGGICGLCRSVGS